MKKLSATDVLFVSGISVLCSLAIACGSTATSARQMSASVQGTSNPLVAQFSVLSPCPGQAMVEFGTDTTYGRSTAWYPVYATAGATQTPILVAGMKASTTYHMRAQVQCPDGVYPSQDFTFTTGPLPALSFPTLTVTRPSPSSSSPENPGVESIDMTEITTPSTPALVTDRDGNPIWYYDVGPGNYAFPFKLLANGHMLLNIQPANSALVEADLAGNIIRQMTLTQLQQRVQAAGYDFVPAEMHHELLPLPNGHLILLVNSTKNFNNLPGYPGTTAVIGDQLIDLDQNWNPVWAWNSFDNVAPNGPLDVNRHLNGLPDWTHSNGLVYSPDDGNLLLSMRQQSWILKIDYNNGTGTGNILWRLGYQGDFASTVGGIPTDDPSLWFSFQHFPSLVNQNGSETTLAVWDNGNARPLDTNGDLCSSIPGGTPPCYSRATIFQIDESAMVADLTWADAPGLFGEWGGSINQLENGNVEADLNSPAVPPLPNVASQVQEVTQTSSPQVVWQMQVTPGALFAYRAHPHR